MLFSAAFNRNEVVAIKSANIVNVETRIAAITFVDANRWPRVVELIELDPVLCTWEALEMSASSSLHRCIRANNAPVYLPALAF